MLLKFSAALLTEETTRKAVPPLTNIHGHPSRGDRNAIREEAMQALGIVDVPDLDHGLVGEPEKPAEFRRITGEADDYDEPDKPLPYSDEIDHDAMSPDETKMVEAEHLQKLTSWHVRKGTLLGVGGPNPEDVGQEILQATREEGH